MTEFASFWQRSKWIWLLDKIYRIALPPEAFDTKQWQLGTILHVSYLCL